MKRNTPVFEIGKNSSWAANVEQASTKRIVSDPTSAEEPLAKSSKAPRGSSLNALADIGRDMSAQTRPASGSESPPFASPPSLQRRDSISSGAQEHAALLADSSVPAAHQQVMLDAFLNIATLNLLRANRSDVARDLEGTTTPLAKGIAARRAEIRRLIPHGMAKLRDASERNGRYAEANGKAYAGTQHCEAFCGEHAYLMLDELSKGGMALEYLAPIVMCAPVSHGSEKASHCALLYCYRKFPSEDLRGLAVRSHIESNLGHCVMLDAWSKNNKVVVLSQKGDFDAYCARVMFEVDPGYRGSGFLVRSNPLYA